MGACNMISTNVFKCEGVSPSLLDRFPVRDQICILSQGPVLVNYFRFLKIGGVIFAALRRCARYGGGGQRGTFMLSVLSRVLRLFYLVMDGDAFVWAGGLCW